MFWNADGEDNLLVRLLLGFGRGDSGVFDQVQIVLHGVEKQPHVPQQEPAQTAPCGLRVLLLLQQPVDLLFCCGHIHLPPDDFL